MLEKMTEEYMQLAQFQIMAELSGWNCNTQSLVLVSSLSGSARTILAELDNNKCGDFNVLGKWFEKQTLHWSANRSEIFKA